MAGPSRESSASIPARQEGLAALLHESKPPPSQGCRCSHPPTHPCLSPPSSSSSSLERSPLCAWQRGAAGRADGCVTAATTLARRKGQHRGGDRPVTEPRVPASCAWHHAQHPADALSPLPNQAGLQPSFCHSLLAEGRGNKGWSLCALSSRERRISQRMGKSGNSSRESLDGRWESAAVPLGQ